MGMINIIWAGGEIYIKLLFNNNYFLENKIKSMPLQEQKPADIYLFKFNNANIITMRENCSKF